MKTPRILLTLLIAFAALGPVQAHAQVRPAHNVQLSRTEIGTLPTVFPATTWNVPVRVSSADGKPVAGCQVTLYYGYGDIARGTSSTWAYTDRNGIVTFRLSGWRSIFGSPNRIHLQALAFGTTGHSMSMTGPVSLRR